MKEIKSVDSSYINSLLHYNKNHGPNGQFITGDGDGDGIIDDKNNQPKKSKPKLTKEERLAKENEKIISETRNLNIRSSNIEAKQKYTKLVTPPPPDNPGPSITKTGEELGKLGKQVGEGPIGKSGHKEYKDYKELNDNELRQKINRIKNERELSDLEGQTKYIKSGKDKAREILQTLGAVIGIAGTVIGIVATVKSMGSSNNNAPKKINYSDQLDSEDSLMHYGIKGMKWGVINEKDIPSHKKPKYNKFEKFINNQKAKSYANKQAKEFEEQQALAKQKAENRARTLAEGKLAGKKALSVFGTIALGPLSKPIMGDMAWKPGKDIITNLKETVAIYRPRLFFPLTRTLNRKKHYENKHKRQHEKEVRKEMGYTK